MKLSAIIRHVLAACLIAGLLLAPAARSAMAGTCPMMVGTMDCCPDGSLPSADGVPAPKTSQKCPLMALCASSVVAEQDVPAPIGERQTVVVQRGPLPSSEPALRGLSVAPPSRPPRVLA